MFKTDSSSCGFPGAFSYGIRLLLILSSVFSVLAAGQEKPDFTKPFKKCWEYGARSGAVRIIASDNEQIIVSNDNSSIISINPYIKLENWKSEISGRLEMNVVSDENSLFFITEFENENKDKNFSLNSISLKTGITKWQKKLTAAGSKADLSLNKELLFFTDGTETLTAINKSDGNLVWQRQLSKPILFLKSGTITGKTGVLTEDSLIQFAPDSGWTLQESGFKSDDIRNAVIKEGYLLLGYSTGEVLKASTAGDKYETVWKVKTGGSVSALSEIEQGVLVTSLDNFIYMFSSENGKQKWKRRVSGRINWDPLVAGDYTVVVNAADGIASVIDLKDGKVVNQVQLENENYFSGSPLIFGNFLVFQTLKGPYFFSNAGRGC